MTALTSIQNSTVKSAAADLRRVALVTLSPRRKAMDRYYGYTEVFDARTHSDAWLLHRAVRSAALTGRLNPAVTLALREMTAYRWADLLAWLDANRAQWLPTDCEINMDHAARFLNRNLPI